MKKIVSLLAFLVLTLSAFAQRSVFGIAQEIGKSEIVLDESAPPVPGIADAARAFCTKYSGNSMTDAIMRHLCNPEAADPAVKEFTFDQDNNFIGVVMTKGEQAGTQLRLWPLPDGRIKLAVKMVNYDEDSLPRIHFFSFVPERRAFVRISHPEGLWYGDITDFLIPSRGNDITVTNEYSPADIIRLGEDGEFRFINSTPNAISCSINDPDPSHKTNLRDGPGGAVVRQIDSRDFQGIDVFQPYQGWWRVIGARPDDDAEQVQPVKYSDGLWIHSSVLSMHTRNYNGEALSLRKSPSAKAEVVGNVFTDSIKVRPLDIYGDWVKVKCSAGTGWIEASWLCGNSFTYCS